MYLYDDVTADDLLGMATEMVQMYTERTRQEQERMTVAMQTWGRRQRHYEWSVFQTAVANHDTGWPRPVTADLLAALTYRDS